MMMIIIKSRGRIFVTTRVSMIMNACHSSTTQPNMKLDVHTECANEKFGVFYGKLSKLHQIR